MEGLLVLAIFLGAIALIIFFADRVIKKNSRVIKEREENLKKREKEKQDNLNEVLNTIATKYQVPANAVNFRIKKWSGYTLNNSINADFWVERESLKIISISHISINSCTKESIPYEKIFYKEIIMKDIQFYFNTGNFYTETRINGGGGGGSSLGGAIVGGVLFGGAGAVIGSRKEIDPLTSELLINDTRETVIKYTEEAVDKFIHIQFDEMRSLFSLLPGKSIDEIYRQKLSATQTDTQDNKTIKERLLKLKELKESDLITDEEYIKLREKLVASL